MFNIKNLNTGKWLDKDENEFDNPVNLYWSSAAKIHNNHLDNLEDYIVQHARGYGGA